jgi:hypothetical protein
MSNPNPTHRFKKGVPRAAGAGRKPAIANALSTDVRRLIREAAMETGFFKWYVLRERCLALHHSGTVLSMKPDAPKL